MAVTTVRLVRHGRAAAGWDTDPDPDLDEFGWEQSYALATQLAPIGPLDIVTSPLRRCVSTTAPLAAAWRIESSVAPEVREIPSPPGVAMGDRVEWLRAATNSTWNDLGDHYVAYRDDVVRYVAGLTADTVVCSHFVAINAVIGACIGDDRIVIRRLDNCSVTVVEVGHGGLRLVEGGHENDTLIR